MKMPGVLTSAIVNPARPIFESNAALHHHTCGERHKLVSESLRLLPPWYHDGLGNQIAENMTLYLSL